MSIDESEASLANKNAIHESNHVGCYHCLTNNIPPDHITYIQDGKGKTGICPYCSVDAILPNSPTDEALETANRKWFQGRTR